MIKVNLLQSRGAQGRTLAFTGMVNGQTGANTGIGATGMAYATAFGSAANNKAVLINLFGMIIFPICLIYYERHSLDLLRQEANAIGAQVAAAQSQVNQKKAEIAKSSNLKDKAKELTNKLEIMKKLARLRLREIKALDFMQTTLPEKVWFKELVFKSGALMIKGISMTDDDLTVFVRSLEKSRNFSSVVLLQAKEERTKDGSIKTFEISCNVEAE